MRNAEVIRQWQVLREIESRQTGVTIHELATLVKVSTRTIRRDLQALQEAGFSVYDERDENETKRWRLSGSPFKGVEEGLSVADVAALYLSRAVVESLSGWPLADELGQAFAKIERAKHRINSGRRVIDKREVFALNSQERCDGIRREAQSRLRYGGSAQRGFGQLSQQKARRLAFDLVPQLLLNLEYTPWGSADCSVIQVGDRRIECPLASHRVAEHNCIVLPENLVNLI